MRSHRFTRLGSVLAALLVVATVAAPAASAAQAPTAQQASAHAPGYYLSLGDSLGFGYSQAKLAQFAADGQLSHFTGYTEDVAQYLGVPATNMSCPGETTASMRGLAGPAKDQSCVWAAGGGPLFTDYHGSQLAAATSFLAKHPWQRGVITLSIGSNDALPVASTCLTNPSCSALWPALATMRSNLATILTTLRRAAPLATIVVLAPYNPFGFAYPQSNVLAAALDLNISATAVLHLDRVADAFTPINRQSQPSGCSPLLAFCPSGPSPSTDVHPTPAGYAVIAKAIEKALR